MTSTKLRLQSFPRSWRAHRRNKSPKYGAERGTLSSSHGWSGDITQSLSFSFSFLFAFGSLSLCLCFLSISLQRAITTVLPIAWPAHLRHIGKDRLEAQLTILQHPSYLYFLQCWIQIPQLVRNAEITVQCEELEVHSLQTKGEENSSYSRVVRAGLSHGSGERGTTFRHPGSLHSTSTSRVTM